MAIHKSIYVLTHLVVRSTQSSETQSTTHRCASDPSLLEGLSTLLFFLRLESR